jgi:ABC-type transport system involved in multi-copper enzyme maturation permease subunit
MTRIIRAELLRAIRPRPLLVALAGSIAFAGVSSLTVLSSAAENTVASRQGGTTLARLTGPGGATEAFATAGSFVGFFIFVIFIGVMANEFSSGTFRALVTREPHRGRVVFGKLVGLLIVTAGVIALTEVLCVAGSLLVAPGQHLSTAGWLSLDGLGKGLGDYATVLAGVSAWAMFGTTLGVVFRSAPVALGVGFAWAGPFENIVVDSWKTGFKVFPGQVFGSLMRGGTAELGMSRALLTALAYAALAAMVSLTLVRVRDVAE